MYSQDGVKWTTASTSLRAWQGVTYGNGLFVAVACSADGTAVCKNTGGGNRVATSPDGVNWTLRTITAGNLDTRQWMSVTYGEGIFVAVSQNPGTTGNAGMYSYDGINWNQNGGGLLLKNYQGVTYGNGRFVAVASSAEILNTAVSSDGINWTANDDASSAKYDWQDVAYGNGIFVAVNQSGAYRTMYSADGTTWTLSTVVQSGAFNAIAYGDGLFVAVADSGRVVTSADGIAWQTRTVPGGAAYSWAGVAYGNGRFVSVASNGTTATNVMYSGKPSYAVAPNGNYYQGGMVLMGQPASTGGTLGIGTTTPVRALTISDSAASQLMLTDGSLTSTPWNFRSASSNLYFGTSSPTTFATTSISAFTILGSSGNVGISTTTPARKLAISDGTAAQLMLTDGSSTSNPWNLRSVNGNLYIGTSSAATYATSTTPGLSLFSNGLVSINNADATGAGALNVTNTRGSLQVIQEWSKPGATSVSSAYARVTSGLYDEGVFSLYYNDTLNPKITLDANTNSFINTGNNFGIGTTTPARRLTVTDSTASQLLLTDGSSTSNPWNFRSAGGNLYFATSSPTTFATTSVSALSIIGASGNVGIGTSSPWATLSVGSTTTTNVPSFAVQSGATTSLMVSASGVVGIATSSTATATSSGIVLVVGNSQIPSGNSVAVFGSAHAIYCFVTPGSGVSCTSDARYKKNVTNVVSALDVVDTLRPVTFNWKGEDDSAQTHAGFIAQEVLPLLPDLVKLEENGQYSMNYAGLTPYLTSAIQQISKALDVRGALTASSTLASNYQGTTGTAITVDATGNVGVGTSQPTEKMTVAGSVFATAYTVANTGVVAYDNAASSATIPQAVLTTNGKVDLYKLATYNLSGVQAIADRLSALTIRMDSLEERLAKLESGAVANETSVFSTSTLQSALGDLGIIVQKGVAQFGTLVSRQFAATTDADGTSSAASVTINAGNTYVEITSALVKPTTKIFITFNTRVTGTWWVAEKADGKFRVELSEAQQGSVTFDYFLVQTDGQLAAPDTATSTTPYSVQQGNGATQTQQNTTTSATTNTTTTSNSTTSTTTSTDPVTTTDTTTTSASTTDTTTTTDASTTSTSSTSSASTSTTDTTTTSTDSTATPVDTSTAPAAQ